MDIENIDIYDEDNKPFQESFNALRENIKFCCNSKNHIKTIAITSCKPREGKTTVAINFVISLAKNGYNVLLVDADLRKSKIKKKLSNNCTEGITSYVKNGCSLERIICKSNMKNVDYIAAGYNSSNPSGIIASIKFKELITCVREKYDYVIVDTPSLGSVIDGSVVASITDGTVLIVESKAVNREVVDRTMVQLKNAKAQILGVVLNRINKRQYKKYCRYYKDVLFCK
jgi:capsular exopolysaccharide synthesis family protein